MNAETRKKMGFWAPIIAAVIAILTALGLTEVLVMPWAAQSRTVAAEQHTQILEKTVQQFQGKGEADAIHLLLEERIKQSAEDAKRRDKILDRIDGRIWKLYQESKNHGGSRSPRGGNGP